MLNLKVYKLHFTSPLHLGNVRDDYSVSLKTIASDTMYAALISCLAKLGKDIPANGDLGCTITSLFPFYQKDSSHDSVFFLPKPLKQSLPHSEKAIVERKKIKKVAWIDSALFSKALKGEQLFNDSTIDSCIKGEYMTSKDIDEKFIVSQVSQRVVVSRSGQEDAVPFYMDRVTFKDYSGLFFIAVGDTKLLDDAIKLLQQEGIGTDRNVGNGFFEYEEDCINLEMPDSADFVISLSSFIPESKQQLIDLLGSDNVAYDFQRRGGWITTAPYNTLRKNVIYAFTYASVFKKDSNGVDVMGRVGVDLKPDISWTKGIDHSIWRCGRAIFLPINI